MKTVQEIIETVRGKEGRYSNNPSDPGGETMWGWTAKAARAEGYQGHMIDMTPAQADAMYLRAYVTRPGFDKVWAINDRIAAELIDTGINCGQSTAIAFLQQVLNVMNQQGTAYRDIDVDNNLGPATLGALSAYLAKRGELGVTVMLRALNCLQGSYYIMLAKENGKLEDFEFGWFANRVEIA